ncbi:cation-translocating P-type ATPase C-terminal domain-containing protein [Sphaerisporangium perillae]|uniref:cation-translocating P-type ATPase C-terminal domain-containing protein n=1 Tax=Sphaerisporangium perillae TaxID=2935860 RepID=UPI002010847D|nr:cation-translocating P-type ATPase C-terminal domain-containing protein [Sphaerisporangium perillae]
MLVAVLATAELQVLVTLVPVLGAPLALVQVPALGWAMALGAAVLSVIVCDAERALRASRTPAPAAR